jgi:thymidylate kinase
VPGDKYKGDLLRDVLVTLEQAGHRTCVLHGYESYPEHVGSDVEIICDDPPHIPRVLPERHTATVVRASRFRGDYTDYRFILYKRYGGEPVFLTCDVSADYRLCGLLFFTGEEFLETRRQFKFFRVPSAELEFCSYLIRKIVKGSLNEAQARRLSDLYHEDPKGCERQLSRFFPETSARLITDSAKSGNWNPIRGSLHSLRRELLSRAARQQPLRRLLHRFNIPLRRSKKRFRALIHPPGLMVTLLGVDGAGKSTVIERIQRDLSPAFARTRAYHKRTFPSALNWIRWRWRGRYRPQAHLADSERSKFTRHGVHRRPPRRLAGSFAKLVFWWLDYTVLGYVLDIYPSLARSTLALFDRYYHDLLVDAKRYRYGGPQWLILLVSRLIPRPDVVILLDAPPEVLYARKQEATPAEVSRQREAYLDVVRGLANGHVVDASQPLDKVVAETEQIILDHLAERAALRFSYSR